MLEWLKDHQWLLWAAGGVSVLVLLISLVAVPAVVVRIESDYFAHERRPAPSWADRRRAIRWTILVVKNVLGVVLVLGGLAMLLLPGQGLLTLLVGAFLLDWPGKYRMEQWLLRRRWVVAPLNWMRRKRGKGELEVREGSGD